jgi:ABC-type multidrug transport system ATPase subunit
MQTGSQFQRNSNRNVGNFQYYLDNISVTFGNIRALRNVQFVINPGEILFITGASGAGKTTLLNVLAGDVKPTSGELKTHFDRNDGTFVSQVFQDLRLVEDLTLEQNLYFAFDSQIYKNKKEFASNLKELSQVLGIHDKLKLKVTKANRGLKQKVAILRALLSKPSVLLADEPTSALEKESATKVFDLLNYYNTKKQLTVVWASHNRELVKQFPGRIVHLDSGRLVYSGKACFI